jgi:hypothetical protein
MKKRLPCLSRWPAKRSENAGDRALGDLDAEHLQFAMNSRRTPKRIDSHHPRDQPANLDSGRRSAASLTVHPGHARPKLAEALSLPADDRVRPHVDQGSAPAVPDKGQPNPEEPIKGSQYRSLTFSLEGCELKAESGILYRNGSIPAHQESNESESRQKEN